MILGARDSYSIAKNVSKKINPILISLMTLFMIFLMVYNSLTVFSMQRTSSLPNNIGNCKVFTQVVNPKSFEETNSVCMIPMFPLYTRGFAWVLHEQMKEFPFPSLFFPLRKPEKKS